MLINEAENILETSPDTENEKNLINKYQFISSSVSDNFFFGIDLLPNKHSEKIIMVSCDTRIFKT